MKISMIFLITRARVWSGGGRVRSTTLVPLQTKNEVRGMVASDKPICDQVIPVLVALGRGVCDRSSHAQTKNRAHRPWPMRMRYRNGLTTNTAIMHRGLSVYPIRKLECACPASPAISHPLSELQTAYTHPHTHTLSSDLRRKWKPKKDRLAA